MYTVIHRQHIPGPIPLRRLSAPTPDQTYRMDRRLEGLLGALQPRSSFPPLCSFANSPALKGQTAPEFTRMSIPMAAFILLSAHQWMCRAAAELSQQNRTAPRVIVRGASEASPADTFNLSRIRGVLAARWRKAPDILHPFPFPAGVGEALAALPFPAPRAAGGGGGGAGGRASGAEIGDDAAIHRVVGVERPPVLLNTGPSEHSASPPSSPVLGRVDDNSSLDGFLLSIGIMPDELPVVPASPPPMRAPSGRGRAKAKRG